MNGRKLLARICAFMLVVSIITVDTLPVFASAVSGESVASKIQTTNEDCVDEKMVSTQNTNEENTAQSEIPNAQEEDAEMPNAAKEDAEIPNAQEEEPETPSVTEETPEIPETPEPGTEIFDRSETESEPSSFSESTQEQETPSGIQEGIDGLIYLDGELYTGYYIDSDGILYIATNGAVEVKTGTVSAGIEYYNCQESRMMKFQTQTVFVEGKTYTGYYIDSDEILYLVTNGTAEVKTGTVNAGIEYYNCQESRIMKFQTQTVFVEGKAYTGYYIDNDEILYLVTNGTAEPKTGTVDAGTKYYNSKNKQIMTLSRQTLYVEGKIYSGYYTDYDNKMYSVKKGTCTLKTGIVKAETNYYSYSAKKILKLSKKTLYVKGKVYSGYYMGSSKKMYSVKKGTCTLKTGMVNAGVKYYSCTAKKTLKLSKKTLYVKGKVYSGYYMSRSKKMYSVKKGTCTLKTGMVNAGVKYYSCTAKKTLKLSKKTLYVKGKVYSGYYMSRSKKMYSVKKGTCTLKTGMVNAGVKYYSYPAKKTLKLSKETLYVKGKVYSGYYMSSSKKMYSVKKGTCILKTGMVNAGTKYYSYSDKKTLILPEQVLYVEGGVYSGYYTDQENKMYNINGGIFTLVNTTLNAGTAYYSYNEGKMLTLQTLMVYVNGKAMEGMSPESLATLQRAQAVVASITNDSMTREEKLRVCFDYVKIAYGESKPRVPHYRGMDWPVIYANDMFLNGSGNCLSYGAAFAYMAKAIGYEEVYCCHSGGHGWAEIDGLVYDPEWSKWHHVYNYFALSYDTPTDQNYKGAIGAGHPWMHVKI